MSLTRRAWMAATGAAAAAAAWPAELVAAEAAAPLPPPLPADVFRDRQARLRAGARAAGVDALFATPSTNLAYSANLAIGRSERLTALLLLTDGPAILITPSFEEGNHRKTAVADDVKTWQEDDDPIAAVGKLVSGKKTLGIE